MTTEAKRSAQVIKQRIGDKLTPLTGIILGSGLGEFSQQISQSIRISYQDLPGFVQPTIEGHAGELIIGEIAGKTVACLSGRAHLYEGIDPSIIKTMVRTLKLIGCEQVLITNAAGSLREPVKPGSLVVIKDHINFQISTPLIGENDDEFGPRFLPVHNAYHKPMRDKMLDIADQLHIKATEGVYLSVLGPSFETPAEIQAFRILGADVIGMSTVPEVIVAHHCGLKVCVVSAITNMGAGMTDEALTHDVTLDGAKLASKDLIQLLTTYIEQA